MDHYAALTATGLIHQVSRELTTALERRLAPHDITTQQAALLINAARGETSPKRLTSLLGTDTAGMTRLLDRLEAKGLVKRHSNPGDRRAIIIEVTQKGRALGPAVAHRPFRCGGRPAHRPPAANAHQPGPHRLIGIVAREQCRRS